LYFIGRHSIAKPVLLIFLNMIISSCIHFSENDTISFLFMADGTWADSVASLLWILCNKHRYASTSTVCWLAFLMHIPYAHIHQDCMVFLFLVFWGISIKISIVAILVYFPTNSA
jgi:hypothetical protein